MNDAKVTAMLAYLRRKMKQDPITNVNSVVFEEQSSCPDGKTSHVPR
jgi:hypothetical protein